MTPILYLLMESARRGFRDVDAAILTGDGQSRPWSVIPSGVAGVIGFLPI